jgi:hypothetical protein
MFPLDMEKMFLPWNGMLVDTQLALIVGHPDGGGGGGVVAVLTVMTREPVPVVPDDGVIATVHVPALAPIVRENGFEALSPSAKETLAPLAVQLPEADKATFTAPVFPLLRVMLPLTFWPVVADKVETLTEKTPGLPGVTVPESQFTSTLPVGSTDMPVYVQLLPVAFWRVTVSAAAGRAHSATKAAAKPRNVRRRRFVVEGWFMRPRFRQLHRARWAQSCLFT